MNTTPPQNIPAEIALLGAVFLNNSILPEIDLRPEDFYRSFHQTLFRAMQDLQRKGDPVDMVSVQKQLGDDMKYGEVADIVNIAVTDANFRYHAGLIMEASSLRKLDMMALNIRKSASEGIPLDDIAAMTNKALSDILTQGGGEIVSAYDVSKEVVAYLDRRMNDTGSLSGVPSGFNSIDKLTDGWQPGDLIVIAARPSMGKTALTMNCLQNAAEMDFPVGIVSLEMTEKQIGERSVSNLSDVELHRIRKGYIPREMLTLVYQGAHRLAELPIYYSFAAFDLISIQKAIVRMVHSHKVKLIAVDYLQLARNTNQKQREREIGEISTTLKSLAKSYNVPIIALSQLNRDVERREDKTPRLADLRDSGQIEQDADVIIFLHRKDITQPQGIVELHFSKGRNIGTGKIELYFDGSKMQFKESNTGG